jgi:hypothetical protein
LERQEIHIPAKQTKAGRDRLLPLSSRVAGLLEMRRLGPDGKELAKTAYVFGNAVGERIKSIKTAWRLICRRAGIEGLHYHDLRREAGSRLLESGRFFLHDVQRFLDHADIGTTSRYLQASRLSTAQCHADDEGRSRPADCRAGDADQRTSETEGGYRKQSELDAAVANALQNAATLAVLECLEVVDFKWSRRPDLNG